MFVGLTCMLTHDSRQTNFIAINVVRLVCPVSIFWLYRMCVILFNAKLLLTLHTRIYFVHIRGRVGG